jgi:hypothetical protein
LSLQHRQVALMEDKDRAEKEAEKGRDKMLKNYGDVLSNTVFLSASKTTISPVREAATGSQFKYPGLGAKADSVSAAGNKTCSKCHSAERLFKDCPLRGAVD